MSLSRNLGRAISIAAIALAAPAIGQIKTGAGGGTEIAEAARPVDEGVPEVAVYQLQKLVTRLSGADAVKAKEKLAEALIAARRSTEALRLLDEPVLRDSTSGKFLRAQAFAALNRSSEALQLYREVANNNSVPQRAAAAFGAGEMLRALDRADEAIRAYQALENDPRFGISARLRGAELFIAKQDSVMAKRILDGTQTKIATDKRQKRLLHARIELLNQRPEKAVGLLDSLVKKPESESRETAIAALFAMADAHLQMNTPEAGDDYLEDFIDRHPVDPALPQVFAKLDQVYRAERKPPRNELEKWARDAVQPRRGFARWYLAQSELRAGRREEAIRQFEQIRRTTPLPAVLAPALLQYARLQIEAGRVNEALAILSEAGKTNPTPQVREQIDFESGRAMYAALKFQAAADRFETLGNDRSALAPAALVNASLASLRADDKTKTERDKAELVRRGQVDEAAEVALEQAVISAERGEKNAGALLQDFVRRFPDHPRVSEAQIALAEMAYHSTPPKLDEAEKNLAAARATHPTELAVEHADYLAIWLADARGADSDRVIASARDFLRAHPNSPLVAEVRLKLAESHFRRQDFASAQTEFETLAQENPKSALTEQALFLAAQSAMASMASQSLDHALELLTQVVAMNGEFRWAARNEQAAIERRLGKSQDAQALYDEVLKGDARAAEKREALCGKADILFEQANANAANLDRAVEIYDQLANEAANQPHWRNQALFKKGVCLEKESDRDGALATFYRILEFNPSPDRPPEFFWFYKAGFNAARLLEEQQKWEAAAAIYEKLVAANGPRSEEASARLGQLRLEHFLWQ
jgi:outer membrane protein assembly factor BamD (BamD/ComL family)